MNPRNAVHFKNRIPYENVPNSQYRRNILSQIPQPLIDPLRFAETKNPVIKT